MGLDSSRAARGHQAWHARLPEPRALRVAGALPRGGLPIEHAIKALEEVGAGRRTLGRSAPGFGYVSAWIPPGLHKTLQHVVHRSSVGEKMVCAKPGFSPGKIQSA